MIKIELVVKNRTGLHARPAAAFVEIADKFSAKIDLCFEGVTVNAKSIIGVLSLGIGRGDKITLIIDGEDEKEAAVALTELFEENFKENGGFVDDGYFR